MINESQFMSGNLSTFIFYKKEESMEKEHIKIKYPKFKIILGSILLMLLAVSTGIAQTVLMRDYAVKMIVNVVLKNYLNIIIISALLIGMDLLEISIIKYNLTRKDGE